MAQYHSIPRYYDVTFYYRNDSVSGDWDTATYKYEFGDYPNPVSLEINKHYCDSDHMFYDWSPYIDRVTDRSPKTYKAIYYSYDNIYGITWIDSTGSITNNQKYQELIDVKEAPDSFYTPTHIWIFDGWTPDPYTELTHVPCNDTTFRAIYHGIDRYYDVTYIYRNPTNTNDWDTVMHRHQFGDILNPDSLEGNRIYCDSSHTFITWNPPLERVTENSPTTYVAQYVDTVNKYNVVWKNWNDTVLSTDILEYQDPIVAPANPVRKTETDSVFFFNGWIPDPATQLTTVPCRDTVFKAQYTSAPRYYDVTIILKDTTTHITGEYDSVPNLTRFETDVIHCDSTYTFSHWSPAVHVQGTTTDTYKAVYIVTVNKYVITWKDYNDAILRVDSLECNNMPSYSPDPTRASDCDYHYSFNEWTPAIVAATQDATYKATYTATLRDYYITWKDWNDTVLRIDTLHCSDMPTYTPNPYRPGDSQKVYNFASWTPSVVATAGDAIYKAQYDSAEAYTVDVSDSYLECWGTVLHLKDGSYYTVKTDTVLVIHKHFPVIPFPETGDTLDCDSIFTSDITVYKVPEFDMASIPCPEAVLGTPLKLDATTAALLAYFTGAEDQIYVVDSWWEIYEKRNWSVYDGHRILSQDPIKLKFIIATAPCGDTLVVDYPNEYCDLVVQDANADNCEDCNNIDCVDALYEWLLIYKNRYMREVLGYDVTPVNVTWYKVVGDVDDLTKPELRDDRQIDVGFYLTIEQNFNGTGSYYALVDVRTCQPDTLPCRGIIRSRIFNYNGGGKLPEVNLIPTETDPQGLVTIYGLNPMENTQIYVYDMAGKMILSTKVQTSQFEFVPNAPDGVYRVLVLSDNIKETLSFIVK